MPEYDRALMAMRGRIGAHVTHARHDPRETTAAARAALLNKFDLEVDPEGVLAPDERARRADQARKAFYARLAYSSAVARSKRAARRRES